MAGRAGRVTGEQANEGSWEEMPMGSWRRPSEEVKDQLKSWRGRAAQIVRVNACQHHARQMHARKSKMR
eukprot:scaffold22501_cov19-Tisochrysis_lutea.AAC.1